MPLPFEAIARVAVLTPDVRASADEYARFFGVREWALRRRHARALDGGEDLVYDSAIGVAGPVTFELITPLDAQGAFGEAFAVHGPGLSHVVVAAADASALQDETRAACLRARRYALPEGACLLLEAGALPGGCGLCYAPVEGLPAPTQVLSFAHPPVLPVQRLYQVSMIVRDLPAAKARYRELFGIEAWVDIALESGPGMPDAHYYGRPVEHAARLAIGRRADACVELIEPLRGPSVYQDALERYGETMHHIMVTICPPRDFEAAVTALMPRGIVVGQGASIPTLMQFAYLDGSGRLDGLFVEVISPLADDWLARMFPDPVLARIVTGG